MYPIIFIAYLFFFSLTLPQTPAFAENESRIITLDDALKHVYESNPTLLAAREELKETQELYPQARAGWLPTLSAETSVISTDVESSNFGSGTGATTKDVTVSLDQPIFRGGRTFAETARAENLIKAGEFLLKQTEQDIFLETATAYMNLLRDAEIMDLRKENENLLQTEVEGAQERYDLGEATITDVHQAKVRYQRAKSETINASSTLEASAAEFLEIVGLIPRNLVKPDKDFHFPVRIEEMLALAEEQNPQIWMAEYEHQAAEHNADAILRELFPQISAFASYNKQYDPQPGIVDESQTETIGLRATIALYQGGATRSRLRESRRTVKKRQHEIEEIKREIKQETMRDWYAYLAACEETEIRKNEIEAAELALDGVREEVRLGQRTILDILDADQDVIDAKITLARAKRNEAVTQFSLAAHLKRLEAQ